MKQLDFFDLLEEKKENPKSNNADIFFDTNFSNKLENAHMRKKRVLSLFSGCGGMDIGFEGNFECLKSSLNLKMHPDWIEKSNYKDKWVIVKPTGFETVFANDIKPDAKAAWVSYFKKRNKNANVIYHLESIVDLVKKERTGRYSFPKDIDIVTGGFPCQDFSVAGNRQGLNSRKSHNGNKLEIDEPTVENRGNLYIWMKEVISIVQPKIFIAENVKGLTNLENVKEIIEKDFSSAADGGYMVLPAKILHAADYGVPQSRERVIFFGFKKSALTKEAAIALKSENILDKYNPYPSPTHNYNNKDINLMPFVTCKDVLKDLKEPNFSEDLSQQKFSKAKFMGIHCQGQKEILLNDIAPTIRSEHHGNIEFRRLSLDNGGKHLDELKQGLSERRLTIRECARIQTFPNDYQFILKKTNTNKSVTATNAYKIIGNAVPCVLAYNLAKNLSEKWDLYFK